MLTPMSTAIRRIRSDVRFQYRAWRMAIDWTVALYIVAPALLIAGYHYLSWWREPPIWLDNIPYSIIQAYLFIIAVNGTVRYYIEEADQLFLVQRQGWFRRVMGTGAAYSLMVHVLWVALSGLLLYPLLHNGYGVGAAEAASLFMLTYLFKVHLMLGKQWLSMRFSGWRGFAVRLVLLPVFGALFGVILAAASYSALTAAGTALVLAATLLWLVPARLRMKGAFYHDIRRERQEKMKVAAMLLSQAGIKAPKKSKAPRKGPLLFPRSGRLFRTRSQENVLAESVIKAVFRSGSKLQFYGYALLAYTTAIAVCPQGAYRYAVGLAVAALLAWMGKSFAKEALAEAYVSLFPWKDGVRYEALWKAGAGIALPGCLWLALLTGLLNAGPLAGFLMLPAGAVICYASSRILGISGT